MPKIYISPAVHEHDRQCVYSPNCSENTHANLFVFVLAKYLTACGIEYKQHGTADKGDEGMKRAVRESNAYQPDIHYVVHTNAYDGTVQGSRPQVYTGSKKGREYAEKILQYRKQIYPYPCNIYERADLYELSQTNAPCVYEELVFHDNVDDCKWFHENMRLMAEHTCRAFCDIFGIPFVDPFVLQQGDVNGDGTVDAVDALLAMQSSVGLADLTADQKKRADMDGDGNVDSVDALDILNKIVGK